MDPLHSLLEHRRGYQTVTILGVITDETHIGHTGTIEMQVGMIGPVAN